MRVETDSENQVKDIAASLCGGAAVDIFPAAGGRNSRIYRAEEGGRVFALKFYRPDTEGKRERFEAETSALELFEKNGIQTTARLIAKDKVNNCVLMEWLEGERVDYYGAKELKALAEFIEAAHKIVLKGGYQQIRRATEASLNGGEILRQINLRLSRLEPSKKQYPELANFIDKEFAPAFNEISGWSQKQYKDSGLNFSEDISLKQQTLSVVDLGFHNVLRKGNKFYFLDFEFFGWDDPVKLVADTLQHPGMMLDSEKKQILFSHFIKIFNSDKTFLARLRSLYPLFGLKWCMIMLNQFLPGYKQLAAEGVFEKEQQLKRVQTLVKSMHEHFKDAL